MKSIDWHLIHQNRAVDIDQSAQEHQIRTGKVFVQHCSRPLLLAGVAQQQDRVASRT
jgi:hypothetical protein